MYFTKSIFFSGFEKHIKFSTRKYLRCTWFLTLDLILQMNLTVENKPHVFTIFETYILVFFLSFTWMLHHLHMLKTFQEISFQWCLWENLRHYRIFNIKETSQRLVFNVFIRNFWTWEHFQRWNNFRKFSILLVKFSCRKFKTQQWMFVLFCFD